MAHEQAVIYVWYDPVVNTALLHCIGLAFVLTACLFLPVIAQAELTALCHHYVSSTADHAVQALLESS